MENKKYTVILVQDEKRTEINLDNAVTANMVASLFTANAEYDTIMLVDNSIGKGIHFDPKHWLTEEQLGMLSE